MFVSDTLWFEMLGAQMLVLVYACVLMVSYYFPATESNEECAEEGEVFEYQEEEDQGLANQGKPSILDTYLILFTYFACFIKVYQTACFYIAIVLVAVICWLKLHKLDCYHPSR
jgi:hypothetical protein